ncbi:MAG: hypothetical protein IJ111_04685 [Eggerthellaceae bacterium]|nr:hypothetical protein [Eggerthellaceae bacterium]
MNGAQRKEFFSTKPMAERIAHDVRNCGAILRSDRNLESRGEGGYTLTEKGVAHLKIRPTPPLTPRIPTGALAECP